MIVVILCGGVLVDGGKEYSFPKPLNMIHGKPAISYCLQGLPESVRSLHFIVAPHLIKYNFAEIVINEFKDKTCIFHYLPYYTRGPLETAYVGTRDLVCGDENIVFLDNDILYTFPESAFLDKKESFIGYSEDATNNEQYSFVKLNEFGSVIDIKEKVHISNLFCCGFYGFVNIGEFRKQIERFFLKESGEFYMSKLFLSILKEGATVKGIRFDNIYNIGTLSDLKLSWPCLTKPKMRICFDLDNTLVTYPVLPNDYTTVKPILSMVKLVRRLHDEGHTIIIHTARRMKTHKHNVGAVLADIGLITLKTLEEFDIPYDEILFGKPIADMYIDDKAVNPYLGSIRSLGYLYDLDKELPFNSLKTNKFNSIEVRDDFVIKKGPVETIRGEIFFYTNIPKMGSISDFFPKYIDSTINDLEGILTIEHIKGVPFFTLYRSNLLQVDHINKCVELLDVLHSFSGKPNISLSNIVDNYVIKLKNRFSKAEDYPFDDAQAIQEQCIARLEAYLNSKIEITYLIHGDFWFSNIILEVGGQIKVLDMKGQVAGILTTCGDRLYDYGKMYQSVLGYDCVLNGVSLPGNAKDLREHFEARVRESGINLDYLSSVTFSLVIGTLPFIETIEDKIRVWAWIKATFL